MLYRGNEIRYLWVAESRARKRDSGSSWQPRRTDPLLSENLATANHTTTHKTIHYQTKAPVYPTHRHTDTPTHRHTDTPTHRYTAHANTVYPLPLYRTLLSLNPSVP